MSVLPFYLTYIFHLVFLIGFVLGGAWNFAVPVLAFIIVPLLDIATGRDHHNYTAAEYDALEARWSFRIVTMIYGLLQVMLTVFGAWAVSTQSIGLVASIGITVSVAVINGNGINFSHELLHKNTKFERLCANLSLMVVSYMHFIIEHTSGHHVRVATLEDPATARRNESFYRFFPRTVIGSFKSAWELEMNRLRKRAIPRWHWRNRMLWYIVLPSAFCGGLVAAFGWIALPYFIAQSIGAFTLLELVNYIEHYGLLRKEVAPGRYESVKPIHSWEARERLTNYLLIKLQRHADHHVNPVRRYQALRVFDESPQMPTGYTGMMLLALVPPLFFRAMNPLLDEHERRLEAASGLHPEVAR
jgi:alkane 1-monooxygenase